MAITDTRPVTEPDASSGAPPTVETVPAPARGLAGLLGTGDHTRIGRLYLGSSLLFLVLAGVLGELVAIERVDSDGFAVFSDGSFLQAIGFHNVVGVFLFLLPLFVGLATVVVPLQVGARTVAFPRAAAAAFWTHLLAGLLVVVAFTIDGGPYGARAAGVEIFVVAFAVLVVALLVAMICVVTTVLTLRAPGMTLDRVPLFAWSSLVAGVMWLLTLPVLLGGLVLLYLDLRYGQVFLGASDGLYPRMAWVLGQPQVYAFAVPALGVIGEIVPVMAGRRSRLHPIAMVAIAAFGAAGFGAYAQRAFDPDVVTEPLYVAFALLAMGALVVCFAVWGDALRRQDHGPQDDGPQDHGRQDDGRQDQGRQDQGRQAQGSDTGSARRPRLASPLLYAAAAALMLLVGVASGVLVGIDPLELTDTTWATAQVHYVLLGAAIAGLGGVQYWAAKVLGRPLGESLGALAAAALLAGTVALAFPDLVSGAVGDDESAFVGIEALNAVVALGGALIVLGVLLFLVNLLGALRKGGAAGRDPWDGHTLEWLTASPPVAGDAFDLPEITSATPALDARTERDDHGDDHGDEDVESSKEPEVSQP